MKKVYISSHSKEQAENLKRWLCHCELDVVSTWHDQPGAIGRSETMTDEEKQAVSVRNFPLIDSCDALVLISTDDKVPGGKFVEAGYAIGKGKKVVIYGRRENLMLWNASISQTFQMGEVPDLIKA